MKKEVFIGMSLADSLLTEEERALKMAYIHRVPDYLLTEGQEKLKRERLQVLQDEVLSKYLKMDEEGRTFSNFRCS